MVRLFWNAIGLIILPVVLMGQDKLPLHVERLSDRAIVIQTGTGNSNVAVLASEKGLVMLDAGFSPYFAEEVKAVAQEVFQQKDWYGMIHTNPEMLNAGGNSAFDGKNIIAHEAVSRSIDEKAEHLSDYLNNRADAFQQRVDRSKKQLADVEQHSERAKMLREWIRLCDRVAYDLKKGFDVLKPTLTFQNQLVLHLGDLTAHLYYFGRTPEDGQVFVWVPEEEFLWLADAFHAAHILPYGSYGSEGLDVTPWLCVLDDLLDGDHNIRSIFRTNGKEMWTQQSLVERRDFIRELLNEVHAADAVGSNLQDVLDRLVRYEEVFPAIQSWEPAVHPGVVRADITNVVTGLWKVNHNSAADTLFLAFRDKSRIDAGNLFNAIRCNADDFYVLEGEFNTSGYRLLGMDRLNEAVEMFKIAVSLFPESANVYDSLGEAYLAVEDRENAIRNYRKSLELNPDNENAKEVLKRLANE